MATADRTEVLVETGLEYYPGERVRVRVVHREQRILVTDDGRAIEEAGRPARWREIARRLGRELDVNISRHGVVSLPVMRTGPGEDDVIARVSEATVAFYQELLELPD